MATEGNGDAGNNQNKQAPGRAQPPPAALLNARRGPIQRANDCDKQKASLP
jgi:hypothetical protein